MKRFSVYLALILLLGGCAGNTERQALKRGMRALEKGRYAESISLFQRGLANITSNDERAIVLNCMGISYYRLGQKKNARQLFANASAANPALVEPIYNLGIVSLETGDEDKAIACFEKAALLSRDDTRALEFLAIIHSQRQQWEDAKRVLNEASRETRFSPRILTALAVTEVKAGNTSRALELLQEALEKDAHYAPAIYNLAVINQRYLNKNDQALPLFTEYTRLVSSGPQADQARLTISEIKNSRAVQPPAAKTEKKAPEVSTAKKPVKTAATDQAPATQTQQVAAVPATFPTFDELMQVAKKLEQQGRKEAAFNNYLNIARAAERAGKASIANQAIRHAILLAEDNSQATYDLGIYFMEKNKKDEALTYFRAAADKAPNTQPAALALARLSLEKSDYDTAIISLKKADQIKPEDPEALWLLADLYDRYLCISNSAASAYAQFMERFPKDRRFETASSRLKILNPESKPQESVPDKRSRPFWQRMVKSSVTNQ